MPVQRQAVWLPVESAEADLPDLRKPVAPLHTVPDSVVLHIAVKRTAAPTAMERTAVPVAVPAEGPSLVEQLPAAGRSADASGTAGARAELTRSALGRRPAEQLRPDHSAVPDQQALAAEEYQLAGQPDTAEVEFHSDIRPLPVQPALAYPEPNLPGPEPSERPRRCDWSPAHSDESSDLPER